VAPASVPLLLARQLVRRYGSTRAVAGVDLNIEAGERVALLGPNGAGKTTLIRVLATALRPHAGSLEICGLDAVRNPGGVRCFVGMVGHQTYLDPDLTPRENLRFYGRLYGVGDLEARATAVLAEVGADSLADHPTRALSRGMQQRVALARAILHQPRLLLLDEPETGLDATAQERLAELATQWAASGGAVLLASHREDWVRRCTDRAVQLHAGRVQS
jgi:heme ABC exporter ATP-binding subunit CcmA